MGSPSPRDTLAMTSGSSWNVVAFTIAAARAAGSPDLKIPDPTNTPSAPSCIIIAASAGNDAGGIATYSQDGATYGYAMLWTILLMTFSLVVVQEMAARMGAVTGKGFAALIRERFGIRPTLFAMLALLFLVGFLGFGIGVGGGPGGPPCRPSPCAPRPWPGGTPGGPGGACACALAFTVSTMPVIASASARCAWMRIRVVIDSPLSP